MRRILSVMFVLAIASVGYSTTLTQLWKIQPTERDWLSTGATNGVRGMAYNPLTGNLLIASTDNGNFIRRIKASDGTTVTPNMDNTQFITAGTGLNRVINKVGVAGDGAIYAVPLTLTGGEFRLYRFANETAIATVGTTETSPSGQNRTGDDMAVTGSGTGTKILLGMSGFGTLTLMTTADGITFTRNIITPATPPISSTPSVDWAANGSDYWFRNPNAGVTAQKYNSSNVGIGTPTAVGTGYGPIGVGVVGSEIVALGIGNSAVNTIGKPVQIGMPGLIP